MYSSTSRPATTSVQSCLFDDEEDNFNDNGNKTNLEVDTFDLTHEVYLCMVWHGGFLGLAFYELGSLQVHFMLDVQENDNFSLVRQVVHQIHPSVIALNSIQDSRLLSFLRVIVSEISVAQSGSSNDICRLEFLPNVDFNYQVSKRRILALNLPSIPRHLSGDERYLHFASLLPFGSSNMMSSVGGLLKYLEKTRVGIELETDIDQVPVLGFKAFIPEHQIQMDGSTYCALKIFETEIHPSTYKAGHKSGKEGLSLYGILNRCKSRIGSRMLREWFLRPLKSATPVRQRHEAVAFFLSPCNMEVVQCFTGCLKHIKYIPKILLRMSKAQATIGDWIALYKTLYHAVYIGDIAKAQPGNIEIFRKIKHAFSEDLHKCVNLISKTIDFEESKIKKRFVVLPHIDKTLDEKKRMFNGLPDLMSEVARQEIEGLSSDIKECVVSYLPEIGYLLVIEMPEGKTFHDDHTVEGMEFMFVSDNQLFYKSPKTLELDDLLGDTQLEISDIELKTMHRLQATILESTSVMLKIMELSAELDCLMALATCAKEFDYIQPQLVEENMISVKAGRHPLQELCCNVFVPNDISMGGDSGKMKLITGPNACGKSVYLKQVALIVYMAHIGSFVPAEEAKIGPCDGIFTRLKSIDSVALNMSTFMQDLSQVSQALNAASASSLIIFDEFGKGTESTDGLSLLTAVMKFWMGKESDCPLALISTHFHNIIHQRLLPNTSTIEFLTFDTLANEEELVYLYQLIPGHTSSSYACKCAVQVGIPSQVTQRGQQVSDLLCQYKTVPLEDSESALKRRQMHERIVDKFLDLNLGVDDVKGFLKDFVLKQCEDQKKGESLSIPKDSGNQAEKVAKAAICSTHLRNVNKSTKSNSNEDMMGLNTKRTLDAHFKKQKPESTKFPFRKSDTTSVLTSAKNSVATKSGQFSKVDLTLPNSHVLCGDSDVQKANTGKNEFSFIKPNCGGISSGNSGDGTDIERLSCTEDKNSIQQSSHPRVNQNKQSFQAPHTNLLYATPNNLRLMNEIYRKYLGSSSLAVRKRKGENLEFTQTQIKHENLFNPPTPYLSYPDRTSTASAPSTKMSSAVCSKQDSTTTTDTDAPEVKQKHREMLLNQMNPKPQLSPVYTSDDLKDKAKNSSVSAPLSKISFTVSSRQDSTTTTDTDAPKAKHNRREMLLNQMNPKPQISPEYTTDDLDDKERNFEPPNPCFGYPIKTSSVSASSTKMSSTVCSRQDSTTTTDTDDLGDKTRNFKNLHGKKSPLFCDVKEYSKPSWKVTSGNSDISSKSGDRRKNPSSVVVAVPSAVTGCHKLRSEESSTEYPSTSC